MEKEEWWEGKTEEVKKHDEVEEQEDEDFEYAGEVEDKVEEKKMTIEVGGEMNEGKEKMEEVVGK